MHNDNFSPIVPNNATLQNDKNVIHIIPDVTTQQNTSNQKIDVLQQLINGLDKDSEITIKIKHRSLKPKQNKPLSQNNNNDDHYLKDYYSDNEETLNIPVWQISAVITLLIALLVVAVSK